MREPSVLARKANALAFPHPGPLPEGEGEGDRGRSRHIGRLASGLKKPHGRRGHQLNADGHGGVGEVVPGVVEGRVGLCF
mgnify:CR=1 FL=1